MKPAFSLEGQVAIITGASRGIGAGIARHFSAAGASVVVCARKLEELGQLAEAIENAGGRALAVAAHMGKLDNVQALLRQAVERFGKVDVLVNNAATNPYFGPLCDVTEAAWDKTFEVNLKGYFYAAREVIRHLQGSTGGHHQRGERGRNPRRALSGCLWDDQGGGHFDDPDAFIGSGGERNPS